MQEIDQGMEEARARCKTDARLFHQAAISAAVEAIATVQLGLRDLSSCIINRCLRTRSLGLAALSIALRALRSAARLTSEVDSDGHHFEIAKRRAGNKITE